MKLIYHPNKFLDTKVDLVDVDNPGFDPKELKERIGWATSDAFEIDIVAVSDKKAHVAIRNVRRLRGDGSLIEEATAFYAF